MGGAATAEGPDFSSGIAIAEIPSEGTLAGRVGEDPVLLSRIDGQLFAVSGSCTHYGAALGEGLLHKGTVRCPLHHACFDLRTGRALHAPALDDLDCWDVRVEGDRAFVTCRTSCATHKPAVVAKRVGKVVIIGGGAAGLACANRLRKLGYEGAITMLSAIFGVVTLLLSAIGLYGMLSANVSQRTGEIGIRVALGATSRAVVGMLMQQSGRLAAFGAAVGLLIAFLVLATARSFIRLENVSILDPGAFAAAIGLVIAAAAFATYVPARKASRIDPAETLRADG